MPPKSQWLNTTCICFTSTFVHFCWEPIGQSYSSSPNLSAGKCRRAHGILSQRWGPNPSSSFNNPFTTLAHNSLSELQFLHFSDDIMTLRSSRSMLAYFMNLSMDVPYTGHVSGGYGNISPCDVRQGCLWHKPGSLFCLDGGLGETVCQPSRMGSAVHGNSQACGDVGRFFVSLYT